MDPNVGGVFGQSQREMTSPYGGRHMKMRQIKLQLYLWWRGGKEGEEEMHRAITN